MPDNDTGGSVSLGKKQEGAIARVRPSKRDHSNHFCDMQLARSDVVESRVAGGWG
jgi:hypothetical protein